ncbi:MAG: glycosyl hydrolase family 8 [Bulleidia sp.]|nr:glycosyl hydrolase family 8 [Bulleidia sp.]
MKNRSLVRIIVCCLAVILICQTAFHRLRNPAPVTAADNGGDQISLSSKEDLYPQNLRTGMVQETLTLEDADGNSVSLKESAEDGKGLWLVFFASWCPDCEEQLQISDRIQEAADQYGYRLIYIDRLNPEKESVQAAEGKLKEHGISADCFYDRDEVLYHAWGIKEIPTMVILDSDCRVVNYTHGVRTAGECFAFAEDASAGKDRATRNYVLNAMSSSTDNDALAIQYSTDSVKRLSDTLSSKDVLSESQGLMMQYAAIDKDTALFNRLWKFTKLRMLDEKTGLISWRYSSDGKVSDTNALLDDLRIVSAMHAIEAENGADDGITLDKIALEQAIAENNVNHKGQLVNYISFDNGKQADQLSLCYIDVRTLESIADDLAEQMSAFQDTVSDAESVLADGYISDEFPLFYGVYDYKKGKYLDDSLNMSEELLILLHLSQAGKLPETSLNWVRQRVAEGTLWARYETDGTVADEGKFFSTSVYAIAAMIGQSEEDPDLTEKALQRMQRYRIDDKENDFYGRFGDVDSSIVVFDELLPMRALQNERIRLEEN